jgi:hypothetical protein
MFRLASELVVFVPATHIAATSRITFQLEGAVELFNDLMTPCIRAFELSSAKSTHSVEYVGIFRGTTSIIAIRCWRDP